jgi:DNA-binding beta-propeller fold protein YncE
MQPEPRATAAPNTSKGISIDVIFPTAPLAHRCTPLRPDGGTHGSGLGQFDQPTCVRVAAGNGKIYVADRHNDRIVRIDDMTGANFTAFGTVGSGLNQLHTPNSLAFDTQGKIYIADLYNNRIVRIDDMSGAGFTSFCTLGSGKGQLTQPADIYVP